MKKTNKKLILLATGVTALVVLLVTPMTMTMYLYNQAFGLRVDTANDFYDYIIQEHPDFIRYETTFPSDQGQLLAGYFYSYPQTQYKGLIVLAHGMTDGHNSYIAECEYLARSGYLIFTYDGTGTNQSQGEKLIGLSQSAIDLKYGLDYLATITDLAALPLGLYGHSWGGFAVAAVSNYEPQIPIAAIVSVAGFEQNSNVLYEQGTHVFGSSIGLFLPYVNLYERIIFHQNAAYTGLDGLAKTRAQVLLIHSIDDPVVNYQNNFLAYQEAFGENKRFTFLSLTHHGHNVTLQPEAQEKITLIDEQRTALALDETDLEHLNLEEKKLTLALDRTIMNQIIAFYDQAFLEKP